MIAAGECPKCDQEHRRCHAHVYRPEEGGTRPCGAYPIKGGTVCPVHGGMAPQTQAAAARVLAEREAVAQAQQQYARRRPSEILLDALHKADALAQKAAAEGWADADVLAQRAATLAQTALARDLEGNEARIVLEQGMLLAGVIRRVLDRLDLTAEQEQRVPVVVSEELRAADVPESASLTAAVRALVDGVEARLTEQQVSIVAQAWRRVMVHLALDEDARQAAERVFLSALRALETEQQAGAGAGVGRDAEPVG